MLKLSLISHDLLLAKSLCVSVGVVGDGRYLHQKDVFSVSCIIARGNTPGKDSVFEADRVRVPPGHVFHQERRLAVNDCLALQNTTSYS